jgi:hypothetical protein
MSDPKNEALRIFLEFGPELKIPRQERMAASFPDVPASERTKWFREFQAIDKEIWKIVGEGAIGRVTGEAIGDRLRGRFPWLDDETVGVLINRAGYYAWREGYRG